MCSFLSCTRSSLEAPYTSEFLMNWNFYQRLHAQICQKLSLRINVHYVIRLPSPLELILQTAQSVCSTLKKTLLKSSILHLSPTCIKELWSKMQRLLWVEYAQQEWVANLTSSCSKVEDLLLTVSLAGLLIIILDSSCLRRQLHRLLIRCLWSSLVW